MKIHEGSGARPCSSEIIYYARAMWNFGLRGVYGDHGVGISSDLRRSSRDSRRISSRESTGIAGLRE